MGGGVGGWSLPLSYLVVIFRVYVAKGRIEISHLNGALVAAYSPLVGKRKGQGIATLIEGTGQSDNIGTEF